MNPSNKRNLAVLGSVVLIGMCVAAFFVGKHAGSRKASPATASPATASPPSAPASNSIAPTALPSTITFFPVASADAAASSSPTTTPTTKLPIHTSVQLSTSGENPSVLLPAACTIQNGVAAASGTFNPASYGEGYVRVGDVVELYVYSGLSAGDPTGTQLADLASEHPVAVNQSGPWQVTVPLDALGPPPAQCVVAVQSTHAFMGAGNAGG